MACQSVRSGENHGNQQQQFVHAMNNKSNGKSRFKLVPLYVHRISGLTGVIMLIAMNGPVSGAGIPVSELTEPGKAYKVYQATAPPIKYIAYERSYSAAESRFRRAGVVTADGAIQQGGYFLRYLTNSPFTTNSIVWGLSSDAEWSQNVLDYHDVCYGPRQFWTNYPASMNFPDLQELQTAARFGLPRLAAGIDNFIWTSQTNFEFDHPWDHYAGHIIRFDNHNRPAKIEYHSAAANAKYWRECYITYSYDSDTNFIPAGFTTDGQTRYVTWSNTYGIDTLEIGTNDHAANGYFLKDFLPDNAEISNIWFMSNWVRYAVQPDGTKVLYMYPSAIDLTRHVTYRHLAHGRPRYQVPYIRIFIFAAGSGIIGIYFWKLWQQRN